MRKWELAYIDFVTNKIDNLDEYLDSIPDQRMLTEELRMCDLFKLSLDQQLALMFMWKDDYYHSSEDGPNDAMYENNFMSLCNSITITLTGLEKQKHS